MYTVANGLQKKLKDHDTDLAQRLFTMECHDLIEGEFKLQVHHEFFERRLHVVSGS